MTANKLFSLIHYLPEHVTSWIGQQIHGLGEKEDQAGVKSIFIASTNTNGKPSYKDDMTKKEE